MRNYVLLFLTVLLVSCAAVKKEEKYIISTIDSPNARLEDVIVELEKSYDIDFNYSADVMSKSKPVNVNCIKSTLGELLGCVFEGQPISAYYKDGYWYLKSDD